MYAPGNETSEPPPVLSVPVPPLTLSCAHAMYSCAPPREAALCSAMCSTRRR